jgi:anti-sigma regulatory factor (Ser/Thr protein kinase)
VNETLWARQAPPHAPSTASQVWRDDLVSPAAITFSRAQLRRHVRQMSLPPGMDDGDLDVLLLTYEELASNAIRHGRLPVLVTVTTVDDGWMIDVMDSSTECAPVPTVDRDPAHGGLGLHLVARLCTTHGWWTEHNRKHVWACINSGDRLDATAGSGVGEG